MNNYTPNLWVIAEMNSEHGPIRKVLGSWYGGYGGSDSWRFSSGITKIIEHDTHYEIHNHSGSVYTCYKGSEGMSGYTTGVYEDLRKKLLAQGASIELIESVALVDNQPCVSENDAEAGVCDFCQQARSKKLAQLINDAIRNDIL
jgi:hypothetical protein